MDGIEETTKSSEGISKRTVLKLLFVVLVTIGLALAVAVMINISGDKLQSSPALKLTVTTSLNTTTELPTITNITFEQTTVPFFYRKSDTPPKFPEISVETKSNSLKSPPIAYRVSVHRLTEDGEYDLTVVFREEYTPQTNDTLILAVRLTDFRGAVIKKTTAFYQWE